MAPLSIILPRLSGLGLLRQARLSLSTKASNNVPEAGHMEPVRQVWISQSTDVFSNLALEDWLYRHHDFEHKRLLLLWRNDPCVVIGRHQNPWAEADVPYLRSSYIDLARSGGGTVYHDLGNLNCTFFTKRSGYERRRNLDLVCSALRRNTALDVSVNEREDIVLDGAHKISGTAAKLGKDNAYHHCTVLVDVNEVALHESLDSKAAGVESKATHSVRVPVKNLRAADPALDVSMLQEALGYEFLRTSSDGVDGGAAAIAKQRGFTLVRPDDGWFPGLGKLREELAGHQWIFGKTPKFKVVREFDLPADLALFVRQKPKQIRIELEVNKGLIAEVHVKVPMSLVEGEPGILNLSSVLHGLVFDHTLPERAGTALDGEIHNPAKREFLARCIKEMVANFA